MKKVLSFKSKSEVLEEEKNNRIFFHDLINHTHGILLFLNQKITYNNGATAEELELLNHEVKLMQTLIKDHFKLEHKNIKVKNNWVPFSELEQSIELLLKIYFPSSVKISMETKGKIAFYETLETKKQALIHYPAMYRIMNNLIKNMAEAHATEMSFYFEYTDQAFIIETKNKLGPKIDKTNIVDYLSQAILKEDEPQKGIGLDSIHEIVTTMNGKFHFDIQDGIWINKIEIPVLASVKNKIAS